MRKYYSVQVFEWKCHFLNDVNTSVRLSYYSCCKWNSFDPPPLPTTQLCKSCVGVGIPHPPHDRPLCHSCFLPIVPPLLPYVRNSLRLYVRRSEQLLYHLSLKLGFVRESNHFRIYQTYKRVLPEFHLLLRYDYNQKYNHRNYYVIKK